MEEIDLKELLNFVKNKIGLLIVITVGISLVGVIYGLFIQKPLYQSYTTVILGGNDSVNSTITQSDITLAKNLVSTYSEIVKSRKVLGKVIDELDLDITYEALYNKVSVVSVNNTEIIKIIVSDENGVNAKNIANVTAQVFTGEVINYYRMNNVNVLDEAIVSENPYNINVPKQLVIYMLLGLFVSAGILFVIFYFDRTIKNVEQVENKIKLPILGSVQVYEKGGKK